MNPDRISTGFTQFCSGARDADLSLFGGYRAGYLRALSDSAEAVENLSTEVNHPAAVAVLVGLSEALRDANGQLTGGNE